MPFIYLHCDDNQFPRTVNIKHLGFYEFPQGDGTHILAMRCAHIGTARMEAMAAASRHGVRAHQFPSIASRANVHPDTVKSLKHHLGLDDSVTTLTTTEAISGLAARWWNHPALSIEDIP